MKKIRNLLYRCKNGGADITIYGDIIRCKLWEDSWLDSTDLYTLLEEHGVRVKKIFAKDNHIYVDIELV